MTDHIENDANRSRGRLRTDHQPEVLCQLRKAIKESGLPAHKFVEHAILKMPIPEGIKIIGESDAKLVRDFLTRCAEISRRLTIATNAIGPHKDSRTCSELVDASRSLSSAVKQFVQKLNIH